MIHHLINALVSCHTSTQLLDLISVEDRLKFCCVTWGFDDGCVTALELRKVLRGILISMIIIISLAESVQYIKVFELLLLHWLPIRLCHILHAPMIVNRRLRILTPIICILLVLCIRKISLLPVCHSIEIASMANHY